MHKLFTDTFRVEWNVRQCFLAYRVKFAFKVQVFSDFAKKKKVDTEGTLDWNFLTHQLQTTSVSIPDTVFPDVVSAETILF